MSSKQATFANEQERAIRIEGQFHTLTERVITAGCGNKYSEEEVGAMRIRMAVLSSQIFRSDRPYSPCCRSPWKGDGVTGLSD
ncbi:hypothetical protein ACOAMY_28265 [Pseudomonas aeruginosa]